MSFPRIALHFHDRHYLCMVAFQPACMHCAFTLFHEGSTTFARAFAAIVVLCGPCAFLVHIYRLVEVKVHHERRAALIADHHRTAGRKAWLDMPPAWHSHKNSRFYYSGFVDRFGAACPCRFLPPSL